MSCYLSWFHSFRGPRGWSGQTMVIIFSISQNLRVLRILSSSRAISYRKPDTFLVTSLTDGCAASSWKLFGEGRVYCQLTALMCTFCSRISSNLELVMCSPEQIQAFQILYWTPSFLKGLRFVSFSGFMFVFGMVSPIDWFSPFS